MSLASELSDLLSLFHDLRNPIGAIQSTTEVLLLENPSSEQKELLVLIRENAAMALDLADCYLLERMLREGEYRGYTGDHSIALLIEGIKAGLNEISDSVMTTHESAAAFAELLWKGDEHLLSLSIRTLVRAMIQAGGSRIVQIGGTVQGETLTIEVGDAEDTGAKPLKEDAVSISILFVAALGGELAPRRNGSGFSISVPGVRRAAAENPLNMRTERETHAFARGR